MLGPADTWNSNPGVLALVLLQAHQRYEGVATHWSRCERLQFYYWRSRGGIAWVEDLRSFRIVDVRCLQVLSKPTAANTTHQVSSAMVFPLVRAHAAQLLHNIDQHDLPEEVGMLSCVAPALVCGTTALCFFDLKDYLRQKSSAAKHFSSPTPVQHVH